MKEAIDASLDHLRPWLPWVAGEPQDVAAKVELLRGFRGKFDLGQNYVYGIFDLGESLVIGGTGLHRRVGPDAFEIGYWIRGDHINRGLATEVAAALTKVAFEIYEVHRVEIHCDPQNVCSAAVPRKLGYTHEATLRRRGRRADGSYRDTMVWTLFRDDYPQSRAAGAAIEAFDVVENRIL